ncbi:MAG: replication initiator protein A [Gemmatimonadaceae bacterium]|nr:replication initiator protein A [Gemmatimonadaceae bacterium]
MSRTPRRRILARSVVLDRALEALPVFRLSDSGEEVAITFAADGGGRWRVLPAPNERLPGTFDQDVYVELLRRYNEAEAPADGVLAFTLHDFLRTMGRRVDGRTYEQLRSALNRLQRTTLESTDAWFDAASGTRWSGQFTILSAVSIDRRRVTDRDQLALFNSLTNNEPGDAHVTLAPQLRANIHAGHTVALTAARYGQLSSPVARRLYRLLQVARLEAGKTWEVPLERLAEQLPLTQRYPSHLQRVLQPAHEMLLAAGVLRSAVVAQHDKSWTATYQLSE